MSQTEHSQEDKVQFNEFERIAELLKNQLAMDDKLSKKDSLNNWDKRKIIDRVLKKNKWGERIRYSILESMLDDIILTFKNPVQKKEDNIEIQNRSSNQ